MGDWRRGRGGWKSNWVRSCEYNLQSGFLKTLRARLEACVIIGFSDYEGQVEATRLERNTVKKPSFGAMVMGLSTE